MPKQKKSPQRKSMKLPKIIRDELRMVVALRGYSNMKCGDGRNSKMQENHMYTYFHGLKKTRPSQIGMLCKGEGAYNGLYKNLNKPVVDKSTKAAPKLYLSHELTQDETVSYVAGLDINVIDLEKRTLTSKLLITGRSILNMAKKGVRYYKKAMAYTAKKWDLSTNEPLDSGDTKDDVIEFVRRSMYLELHATDALDDSSVEGEDDDSDDGKMNKSDKVKDLLTEITQESTNMSNNDIDTENKGEKVPTNEDIVPINEEIVQSDDEENEKDELENSYVPSEYIFPSFMAYISYGPFVDPSNQLSLLLTGDAGKGKMKSRAEKRKASLEEKAASRKEDGDHTRGLTIDQQIKMASYNLQKRSQEQLENESRLVALIAHESALGRQVDAAERRATVRCEKYNEKNRFWMMVDQLMEEQAEVTRSIKNFNSNLNYSTENVVDLDEKTLTSNTENVNSKKGKGGTSVIHAEEDNTDTDCTASNNGSPSKVSKKQKLDTLVIEGDSDSSDRDGTTTNKTFD